MRKNSKRYSFLKNNQSINPTEVFLQQQKLVSTKMSDLKKEELIWLKLYFVYLAVFSLALAKLTIDTEVRDIEIIYTIYLWIIYVSSFLILAMLTYLRCLYYLQKINLDKWENELKIKDKKTENGWIKYTTPYKWIKYTAPYKGFLINVSLVLMPSFLFVSMLRLKIETIKEPCILDNFFCFSFLYFSIFQSLLFYIASFILIVIADYILFFCSIKPKLNYKS